MHLVFMTRGIQRRVDVLKELLLAQRFPLKRKDLNTGKEELTFVQGALRPIQIWEYVFPKESMGDVLGGLQIKGPIERPEIKSMSWVLRKMLKLDQIPVLKPDATTTGYRPPGTLNGKPMPASPVHNFGELTKMGVALYPVGIKEDAMQDAEWPTGEKYHQEML